MHGVAILLTVAALGVEYGWQPGKDGELDYIIQIEPEMVKTLSAGEVDLESEIPAELAPHVKRIRIRIGTGEVPRKGLEQAQAAAAQRAAEEAANQRPNFKGNTFPATDPRAIGTRRQGDGRSTGTSPGRVLTPPARGTNINEAPLPEDEDRFTDTGTLPKTGRTRPASSRTGDFATGDRTDLEFEEADPPTNNGYVWDSKSKQFVSPAVGTGAKQPVNDRDDPRYPATDPRTNPTDPRTTDPRATDPRYDPNTYPPNSAATNPAGQWQSPYAPAPLRDPDRPYYPQQPYAYPPYAYPPYAALPANYQVAANPNPTAATGNPPAANPPTTPTTNATTTTAKPAGTATPAHDHDRDAQKPWGPLTITAIALFASIGLNVYLGWIAHGVYERYRALLMEVRNVRAAAV